MIICPKCNKELARKDVPCNICGYSAAVTGEIVCFHKEVAEDFERNEELVEAYSSISENHFFSSTRKRKVIKLMERYVPLTDKILEIGPGSGYMMRYLIKNGYRIDCADNIIKTLKRCEGEDHYGLYQFDIMEHPFREEYDVVLLFDVLEHAEDDLSFLKRIWLMLKPKGKIILTVPALMQLWSEWDEKSGHKRRYSSENLEKVIEGAGFKVQEVKYFFFMTIPFIFAVRKFKDIIKYFGIRFGFGSEYNMPKYVNAIMMSLMNIEDLLSKHIKYPLGSSIIMVAEKIDQ